MAAYILADVDVTDPEQYAQYRKLSSEAFAAHGVTPLVRGGRTVTLEGREPGRIVVLPFDSVEAAQTFYDSPEYTKARASRQSAAVMNMIIVEGA
jgi:uncharacterized protein (DUF1330 family)